MDTVIFIVIITACLVFIGACIVKKRPDMMVDFLLRAFVGTAGIYLLDFVLTSCGYQVAVGINAFTILTNGLLGLPGFILLYGLAVYYSI